MAGRVTALGGMLLAGGIAVGTWLYVAGVAPPFPWSAWAFHGALAVCLLYALAFGR